MFHCHNLALVVRVDGSDDSSKRLAPETWRGCNDGQSLGLVGAALAPRTLAMHASWLALGRPDNLVSRCRFCRGTCEQGLETVPSVLDWLVATTMYYGHGYCK